MPTHAVAERSPTGARPALPRPSTSNCSRRWTLTYQPSRDAMRARLRSTRPAHLAARSDGPGDLAGGVLSASRRAHASGQERNRASTRGAGLRGSHYGPTTAARASGGFVASWTRRPGSLEPTLSAKRRSTEPKVRGSNPLGRAPSLGRSYALQGLLPWRASHDYVARKIVSDSGRFSGTLDDFDLVDDALGVAVVVGSSK